MRDMIAVLDGLAAMNVSASGGANRSGGSDFFPGAPTMPSSEGLAGLRDFDVPMPGSIEEAFEASGLEEGWQGNTLPVRRAESDYASYLAAFEGGSSLVATREDRHLNPSGSGGANYSGGSDYYPGAPTTQSSEGLARVLGGYEVTRTRRNVSASGGANYSGGSDFAPGFPTMPSSEGLAKIALHGLLGAGVSPVRAVIAARQAVQYVDRRNTPCDQAYQAAYAAALINGYDTAWSQAVAQRTMERCQAIGWNLTATKS